MYYEIHITASTKDSDKATNVANLLNWKTSEIVRDPLLGQDTFFYLTTHRGSMETAMADMNVCANMLETNGVKVLRMKIEHVIYDTKKKLITA